MSGMIQKVKLFVAEYWVMIIWIYKERNDVDLDSTNSIAPVLNPWITADTVL